MRKLWTKEEIKLLKKLYPGNKTREVAEKLDRSVPEVAYKAQRLGLKKKKGHFFWTDEEIALLRKLFPDYRIEVEAIADRLGRGIKAVRTKANQLGLHRGRHPL